jgi:S1-C subfamily serine protease
MVNTEIIPHLKSTCVAIGVKVEGEQIPIQIAGTGFFVDPEGYLVTASHVIKSLKQITVPLNNEKIHTDFGVFWFKFLDNETIQLQSKKISDTRLLELNIHTEKYLGPDDSDVAVCRIEGNYGDLPYLKFKEPSKLALYSELLICGYPGGNMTFNLDKKHGIRTSPLVQTGRISSLMPSDNTHQPVGIQTDIIGTGGSSGAPMVDANDETVIGITQKAIGTMVVDDENKVLGNTNIGLTWGISNYLLYHMVPRTIKFMRTQEKKDGTIKKNLTQKDLYGKIHTHIKNGELIDQ